MVHFKLKLLPVVALHYLLCLCCVLMGFTAYAQAVKQPVNTAEYHLWGTLYTDRLSDEGRWVSYLMDYDNGTDTLFLGSTDGKKSYKFPDSGSGAFCREETFAFMDKEGTLTLLDLASGNKTALGKIAAYTFAANGKYLITLSGSGSGQSLEIRDIKGNIIKALPDVESYKLGNNDTMVICSQNTASNGRIILIDLLRGMKELPVLEGTAGPLSNLTWNRQGQSFAFLRKKDNGEGADLYYYSLGKNKLSKFNPAPGDLPAGFCIENNNITRLTISDDGRKLLFAIRRSGKPANGSTNVQVWNTDDAVIVPEKQHSADTEYNTRIAAWMPETGQFTLLTDEMTPFGTISPDLGYALTYSAGDRGIQYSLNANVNYHLKSVESNEQCGTLAAIPTDVGSAVFSPSGRYFAYFKQGSWSAYDFKERKHITLTAKSGQSFINREDESQKGNYRIAAWDPDDKYVLVYDAFDIWKFTFNGKSPMRLTHGREENTCYRIVPSASAEASRLNFTGHTALAINLKNNVLLSANHENDTGYVTLAPNGSHSIIVWESALASGIQKAKDAEVYAYQLQDYNRPPSLNISHKGKKQLLFQSNAHHDNFAWGKQEVIQYRNSKDIPLQGLLYYPADYNPAKKYPMVVNVYEKQLYMQHYYSNPSQFNMVGFNSANLTAQGYFVLLPDIEYELGNPGLSALDCITAATNKVIDLGLVPPDKIALMGTSFGGYETNFIISQTNLFCTAISGASVFDLESWYLSVGASTFKPEIWRFETQQWRMGKSLYEARSSYSNNSPSTYVENITAPMLIWAGESDKHIDTRQSISLYLALRRLNKKGILLLYPKEGHSLITPNNQIDLTKKVDEWLGFYLNGNPAPQWMAQAIK
jgi:dipeptidyl aminopeptidase/acylaminoacyl peptidase